jgi:hypothetical protein
MKIKLFTSLLLLILNSTFAQVNKFPNGVYLDIEQLKNHSPAYDINFNVIQRTSGDIAMAGGNDYKIESDIDTISKKFLKKMMFAYVKNDSIFLNCIHHKLQTWYALSLTSGNFLAFKGSMTNGEATGVALMGGAIGGAIAAGKRYLYVLSLRTGNVKELTKAYVSERLKEYPVLLEKFNNTGNNNSEAAWIEYLNLLNIAMK